MSVENSAAQTPVDAGADRLVEIERLREAEAVARAAVHEAQQQRNAAAHTGTEVAAHVALAKAMERHEAAERRLAEAQAAAMAEWAIAASTEAALRHGVSYTGLFDRKLTLISRGTVRRWRKADLSEGPATRDKVLAFTTELGLDPTEPCRIYGWALPSGVQRGATPPLESEPEPVRAFKRRLADPSVSAERKRLLLRRVRWLLIEDEAEAVNPDLSIGDTESVHPDAANS